ncbi:MAG: HEAT repeat domain-containing protein [Myxococcota bacterium]
MSEAASGPRPHRAVAMAMAAILVGIAAAAGPAVGEDRSAAAAATTGARGGHALLAGAERAAMTVEGIVREPTRLDDVARRAQLEVVSVLHGPASPGDRLSIAWEERFADRPPRFGEGARVLVALEPLPGWSIWRERLGRSKALGIALRGEAFLADPDPGSIESLGAYLGLGPTEREGTAGHLALIGVATRAASPVARSALAQLDRRPDLAQTLDAAGVSALGRLIASPGLPARRRSLAVSLAGHHGMVKLLPVLVDASQPGSPIASAALDARGRISGGFSALEVRRLLERSEPEVRAMALRHAAPDIQPDPALARAGSDPSPRVRAEAVSALGLRRGMEAYPTLVAALDDPAPVVRGAAASALGALGARAVPGLVERVRTADLDAAREPMIALARAGEPGRRALAGLAAGHADTEVRAFADFLLGRPGAHH